MFKVPEEFRVLEGPMRSTKEDGCNGLFAFKDHGIMIACIVSDGLGWEHVSVSISSGGGKRLLDRCPSWEEMCFVKENFWDKEDTVLEYHPAEKDYVNFHPYCLHLWRPIGKEFPIPPKELVGGA
jgi:hypothetical protein